MTGWVGGGGEGLAARGITRLSERVGEAFVFVFAGLNRDQWLADVFCHQPHCDGCLEGPQLNESDCVESDPPRLKALLTDQCLRATGMTLMAAENTYTCAHVWA